VEARRLERFAPALHQNYDQASDRLVEQHRAND
jgi:hypothetical protein